MKHATVVHRLPHRLRLIAPALVKDAEKSYLLEILLRKHAAIKSVRVIAPIGSVTLHYDPEQLPEARLLALADAVIGNLAAAPRRTAQPNAVPTGLTLAGPMQECHAAVEGMTCASCAALIELGLQRDPRVASVAVNYAAATVSVQGQLSRDELFAAIGKLGYGAQPMDTLAQRRLLVEREKERLAEAKRRLIQAALASVPVMVSGMLMHRSPLMRFLEFVLATYVIAGPGSEIFQKAWALAGQRSANMDTLIALGAGSAYLYSLPGLLQPRHHVYFESAAIILAFVLGGRYMEERAKGQASEAIRKLIDLQPASALRVTPTGDVLVPIDEVRVGDLLRVRPGDKVPTDGIVLEGTGHLDEALLTGEALPVSKVAGDAVVGGTLNIAGRTAGSFIMRVTAVGADTVLSGIVKLVERAQGSKLPVQKLVDRISARFVPSVGVLAGLTFAGWLTAGLPAAQALSHAVAVLLIACPCALGLATPTAIMVGMGEAARRGIYIRNGEALETTATLDVLVFDKTGTLTEGHPVVTDCSVLAGQEAHTLWSLIASVEQHSEHYLARALVADAQARAVPAALTFDFVATPGQGVQAMSEHGLVRIGNAALLQAAGIVTEAFEAQASAWAHEGKTPIFVALDQTCVALCAVADAPRPGAQEAITRLHQLGLRTILCTGDVPAAAQQLARQVGIDQFIAQARPADKLALIERLKGEGHKVGMIGDGINDAPALAAADVGLAIDNGADIAIETADITLLGGDIARVAAAIELARRTMRIIRQNLFWALGYNVVAIPVAAAGHLNPMIAAAAMAMSSVSVVGNSLRLKR